MAESALLTNRSNDHFPVVVAAGLRWLATVTLSLWMGGLLAIGAVVAPLAFQVLRSDPQFHGQVDLQNHLAAAIIGGSFRIFNKVCETAGLLMTTSLLILASRQRTGRNVGLLTASAAGLLTLSAAYLDFGLFPALDAARASVATAHFNALHSLYVGISNAQFLALLFVAVGLSLSGCADKERM